MKRLQVFASITIAILLASCSSHTPSSAVVEKADFSENEIVQSEESVEETIGVLERSFQHRTMVSSSGVKVLYLHPSFVKAEVRARLESNLALSSEDIDAEVERSHALLADKRNCFRIKAFGDDSKTEDWSFFQVLNQDSDLSLEGLLLSQNLFCLKEKKIFGQESFRLFVINNEDPQKYGVLEWRSKDDLLRQPTESQLEELAQAARKEETKYAHESLDVISSDETKRNVLLKALSAHSMRYLKKELPLSRSAELTPRDRFIVLNLLALYSIQNAEKCRLSVVKHLLTLRPSRKEGQLRQLATELEELKKSYACPEWARYVYKWFPDYRDASASHLNQALVDTLNNYNPSKANYLFRVGNSYKYVRDHVSKECRQGKREQCVILEVLNQNFKVLVESVAVVRAQKAQNARRQQKLLDLLEELRSQREREEALPPGQEI